jgi:hypothetical protein
MLFTFKSATSPDLIMLEANGKEILVLLGKNPDDARGIITIEQLPTAIATLKKATAADKARPSEEIAKASEAEPSDEQPISLSQRALPFIEMLERAVNADEPVIWGV